MTYNIVKPQGVGTVLREGLKKKKLHCPNLDSRVPLTY